MNSLKVDGVNSRPVSSYGLLESCGQDRTSMPDDDGEYYADCLEYVPANFCKGKADYERWLEGEVYPNHEIEDM